VPILRKKLGSRLRLASTGSEVRYENIAGPPSKASHIGETLENIENATNTCRV
jgi:hypothetical protein